MGCVLALNFNEGSGNMVKDKSKYGNHGTVYGATWVDSPVSGKALSFDGVDDYVNVPDAPSLDITDGITLECWAKWPTGQAGQDLYVVKRNAYYLSIASGPKIAICYWYSGGFVLVIGNTVLQNNTLYHLVAVFDGSNFIAYVNGVEDGRAAATNPIITNNEPLIIGGYAPYQAFGILDEIRIYNRALSPDEVKGRYNAFGFINQELEVLERKMRMEVTAE